MAMVLQASLRFCNLEITVGENLSVNAYSTFLNYLLPGQGGLVLRGFYLKTRHNLPLRRYLVVTLIYYCFYSVVSIVMLVGGLRAWWQTLVSVIVVSGGAYLGARLYAKNRNLNVKGLTINFENSAYLMLATCIQAAFQFAIYWVELNSLVAGLNVGQVMSYTGAANFALFASITPGGVGIRESFLFISQRLNHITSTTIVGASILDRAVYLLFLAIILMVILLVRGRAIFKLRRGVSIGAQLAKVDESAV